MLGCTAETGEDCLGDGVLGVAIVSLGDGVLGVDSMGIEVLGVASMGTEVRGEYMIGDSAIGDRGRLKWCLGMNAGKAGNSISV